MSTRSEERRAADEDRSSFQNSSQNYPTILGSHDVVEVGEVVARHQGGFSGGMRDDGQQTDYVQVAWLLREKLNDLVDGDKGEFPDFGLRSLLNMASSRNIVSADPKMLNPVLWRSLPRDFLLLVLARLPLPEIIRLRSLSREWRRDMATANSDINQACDEARPIMIAALSSQEIRREGFPRPDFHVKICDVGAHRSPFSYRLHLRSSRNRHWNHMGAVHGGLICFVSPRGPSQINPMCIVVVNLLTQFQRKLPRLNYVYSTLPKMMHIEVDSETKCYRVVVVGRDGNGHPTVEMYDSSAGQWTKATPSLGCIFGLAHNWKYHDYHRNFVDRNPTRSVYDFAEGQLKRCGEQHPSRGASMMTIWKDCKFVVHKSLYSGAISAAGGYYITKYCWENNAKDWVQERSYSCSPLDDILKEYHWFNWDLKACEGFLMATRASHEHWLLDLSSGEWSRFPNFFKWNEDKTLMCRAFWNVVP